MAPCKGAWKKRLGKGRKSYLVASWGEKEPIQVLLPSPVTHSWAEMCFSALLPTPTEKIKNLSKPLKFGECRSEHCSFWERRFTVLPSEYKGTCIFSFTLCAETGWLDLFCALMVGGAWLWVIKASECSLPKLFSVEKKKLNAFKSKETVEEWVRGTESSLPLNQTMDWRAH